MGRSEDARRVQLPSTTYTRLRDRPDRSPGRSSLFGVIAGYGLAPIPHRSRALALFPALGVFGVLAMNAQARWSRHRAAPATAPSVGTLYAFDVARSWSTSARRAAAPRPHRARNCPGVVNVSETSDWRWF